MDDTLLVEPFEPPGVCALCHRTLSSENEPTDIESLTMCGDCKFLFLEENGTPSSSVPRIAPRIRRIRYNNSSESIEDMFSQQFSTMINLARQNPPPMSDTSSRTTLNDSRRWRRVVSDTESEGFDSVYAESDVISYENYEDDSDASVDVHSFLGGNSDTDTDIDPMHAGLNQWSSDEEDEWEEVEDDGNNGNTLGSLIARVQLQRYNRSSEIEGAIRVRISERRRVNGPNPFGNTDNDHDHERSPFVGHSGDYLDSRSFEELLERLAETDNTRRGAPPASISFVNNLELVVINEKDHFGLTCAICKDSLSIGTMVNKLPCLHLYHPLCIKPWLSSRNSCPLCRFELPTDDVEYENRKQVVNDGNVVREDEVQDEDGSVDEHEGLEIVNDNVGRGRGRWLFVAAPLVSLVGIGLALWLGNRGAVMGSVSCGTSQRGNRIRRWWGLF